MLRYFCSTYCDKADDNDYQPEGLKNEFIEFNHEC